MVKWCPDAALGLSALVAKDEEGQGGEVVAGTGVGCSVAVLAACLRSARICEARLGGLGMRPRRARARRRECSSPGVLRGRQGWGGWVGMVVDGRDWEVARAGG